jgi:hypothetical protein
MKFEVEFTETRTGDLDTYFERLPEDVIAKFAVDQNGGVWLSANRKGFLLLAKLFAEVGLRDLGDGWHSHYGLDLSKPGVPNGAEFTIEKLND